MLHRAALFGALTAALLLGACSFDHGGITDDIDAGGADDDRDDDGIDNASDNCPDDDNADQRDEDGDEVGNACDNCPGLSNADQANAGETGAGAAIDDAGDACDPDPTGPGNDLLLFDGFDEAASLDDWRAFLGGNWSISGGALRQLDTSAMRVLYLAARQFGSVAFHVGTTIESLPPGIANGSDRSIGTLVAFSPGPSTLFGYLCRIAMNPDAPATPPSGALEIVTMRGPRAPQVEASAPLNANLQQDLRYHSRHSLGVEQDRIACAFESTGLPAPVSLQADDDAYDAGFLGLVTASVAARFEYVAVYALPAGG